MRASEKIFHYSILFSFIPLILSIGIAPSLLFVDFSQEADATKAVGPKGAKSYGSKNSGKVCGDRLCSESAPAGQASGSSREAQVPVKRIEPVSEDVIEERLAEKESQVPEDEMMEEKPMDEMMQEFTIDPEKIVYENNNFSLVQVVDYIYSFGDGVYFSMIMVTDEGILVADPNNQNHSENLIQAIRTISDQPITYLVYSHNHWDHSSGGQVFKDAEGTTILSHVDARDWLLEHPNPDVVVPDEVWEGNLHEIVLGGKTLQLHHFGPSHGEGMTVFHFPEDKIIFIVDIVTPKRVGFTILPDFFPKEWERTLTEVEALDFDITMFGHDRAYGPASEVTEIREYVQDLRAEINRMIQDGVNPFMIPSTIELPKYQSWSMYDEWLGLNAWRVMLEILMGW